AGRPDQKGGASVRVCVVGGGLAGSLLGWRLAQQPGMAVDLLLGSNGGRDATGASGGAVRGYEALPRQRELAIASMAELLASPVLRNWAGYLRAGFVYLPEQQDSPGWQDGLAAAAAQINHELPGSATLTTAAAAFTGLAGPGGAGDGPVWAGPAEAAAVVEREAGSISPAGLRDAVLADLARHGGTVVRSAAHSVTASQAGPFLVSAAGRVSEHDAVVFAAGAWTPGLLQASGLPADGYRAKAIQYGVWTVGGYCPPAFCDEQTGLYGKPAPGGGLLLGVPTTGWDVPPGRPPVDPRWHERALDLATRLFPRLRPGPLATQMSAVDCYCGPPVLALRPVPATRPGIFTFTGGSGGAAKTALAASAQAALALTGSWPAGKQADTPCVSLMGADDGDGQARRAERPGDEFPVVVSS
ncbi:MAG: NAD(P)/FAD-dependent oxidoreductase, partial [Streptosporangiaceae bacterium]